MAHPRTRDERRALSERWKRRVRGYLVVRCRPAQYIDAALIGSYARTRVPCSCYMCGNPRRHMKGDGRVTFQELRAA